MYYTMTPSKTSLLSKGIQSGASLERLDEMLSSTNHRQLWLREQRGKILSVPSPSNTNSQNYFWIILVIMAHTPLLHHLITGYSAGQFLVDLILLQVQTGFPTKHGEPAQTEELQHSGELTKYRETVLNLKHILIIHACVCFLSCKRRGRS